MSQVKIGWGRREISMNEPLSLIGQMHLRVSVKIHDPLYATALVVDGGEGQTVVAFCSCDVEATRSDADRMVAEKVHAFRPAIPAEAVIIHATHAHTGGDMRETPETAPDGTPVYPGLKYRDFFVDQCVAAIVEAYDNRREGGIGYGYGYAVVGHSRRTTYFEDVSIRNPNPVAPNGHGVMYGKTNDPQFSHYEAGADHFLNLMFTFDAEEKLTGIVVNVPCPSQISEQWYMQSGDYWCEVRALVREKYGEDVYVLTQCAAAGDLSPRILHYNEAQVRRFRLKYGVESSAHGSGTMEGPGYNKVMCERRDIAERIMKGIGEVYAWAKNDIRTEVTVRQERRMVALSRRMVSDAEKTWCEDNIRVLEQRIADAAGLPSDEYSKEVSFCGSLIARNKKALARFEAQKDDPTYDTVLHTVRIGDISFVTTQFETYMDFMHRIQARSPFIQTFVVQLSGWPGATYLPTERAVANRGYSASLFCNMVGPEGGQELVETSLEMLKNLAE